jgi:ubiquitin carboxyl-terminal hydrolase 7
MSYDQFSAYVGERLGVSPTHIRFSTINSTTGKPKVTVRRNPSQTLSHILFPQFGAYNANQRPDALYYEIMDMSLSELETKKSIKITLVTEGLTKEVRFLGIMGPIF